MQEILDNTWYYTLSTTAQVFAAILGLYSVFVIFKIERINEFIEELRSVLINIIASVETQKNIKPGKRIVDEQTLIVLSNEELLLRLEQNIKVAKEIGMSMSFKTDRVAYSSMENIPLTFKYEITRKNEVLSYFKVNLFTMFWVILFPLISLGFSAFITTIYLKDTILALNIISIIIASCILANSILKIIKE